MGKFTITPDYDVPLTTMTSFAGPEVLFSEDECFYLQDFKIFLLLNQPALQIPCARGQERSRHPG